MAASFMALAFMISNIACYSDITQKMPIFIIFLPRNIDTKFN